MSAERSGRNGFLVLNSVAVRERRKVTRLFPPLKSGPPPDQPNVTTLPGVQLLTDMVEKCQEIFAHCLKKNIYYIFEKFVRKTLAGQYQCICSLNFVVA